VSLKKLRASSNSINSSSISRSSCSCCF